MNSDTPSTQHRQPERCWKTIRGVRVLRLWQLIGLLLASVVAAGCSLPGWQLDIEDDSAWYAGADPRHPSVETVESPQYDPVVHQISPGLIRRMRQTGLAGSGDASMQSEIPRIAEQQGAYRVGPGDLLAIIVYGHENLTNPAGTTQSVASSGRLVDEDGEIFVPFIGEIEVAGRSLDQIRKMITEGLSRVIRKPQVDVNVLQYRSQKVYITGDISQPCTVPIRDIPLTVVAALEACQSRSSGGNSGTGISTVKLVRNNKMYSLSLAQLYQQGGEPVILKNGDRLIVDDSVQRVFLIGQFSEQGAIPYSAGGLTLADAMMSVGGLDLSTADASEIYVIRGVLEKHTGNQPGLAFTIQPHVYHLDASSVGALVLANQFKLRPRDIVYAAPASLVNFNRALAQILPSVNLLFRSAVIYDNLAND